MGPYGTNSLQNGIVTGYSANLKNNLIVKNIMMNDVRNNTEYRCVIITTQGTTTITIRQSDPTILYVAGEYEYADVMCILEYKVFINQSILKFSLY